MRPERNLVLQEEMKSNKTKKYVGKNERQLSSLIYLKYTWLFKDLTNSLDEW